MRKYYCPKCGRDITLNAKHISKKEYFRVCLNCDEDFYKFELKTKPYEK